jgi:hypothetical protein
VNKEKLARVVLDGRELDVERFSVWLVEPLRLVDEFKLEVHGVELDVLVS